MKIKQVMTRDVQITEPGATIQAAARTMADLGAGALPVGENDRLVGMLTDRDIAVRAVAEGRGAETAVRDVMSREVRYCYEDQEVDEVAENMAQIQVQRLPVLNREKRLVGIVSLGDIAAHAGEHPAGRAASGIKQPGGPHAT